MDNVLLPCPFCGGKEISMIDRIDVFNGVHTIYRAKCKKCGASTEEYKTQFDATLAWNTRAK